uniref:Uncharacterized protein MANES_14G133500 n=1 Tax=Rhizophora mucronata TaxID=61149 RepID=A0A2P2INK7_RHIMU
MDSAREELIERTASLVAEERGAGGKFRKALLRKPPAKPYDRPPPRQQQRGRWLSKLVDPAFRLISGGANLVFPSFFSKSSTVDALPVAIPDNDRDNLKAEAKQNVDCGDGISTVDHMVSQSTGIAGASRVPDGLQSSSGFKGHEQQQKLAMSDHDSLSEIEQLIKDKTFSREEIDHLMGIICSRAVGIPDVKQEKKYSGVTMQEMGKSRFAIGYSGKSAEQNQEDLDKATSGTFKSEEKKYSSMIAGDAKGTVVAIENSRKLTEEKPEDLSRTIWEASTPLVQSTLQDVGASPIEIARAYMENRSPEVGFSWKGVSPKDEGSLPHENEIVSKSFIPPPSPMSSVCWPGAVVHDQRGYMTPRSQRGRFGLHSFPRTPYSRTIYSRSKSKLQGESDRCLNMTLSPIQHSQASTFGQLSSSGTAYTLDGDHGSVGPIRRIRPKVVADIPSGRSASLHSSLGIPREENFNVPECISSAVKNLGKGETSSSSGFQSVRSKPQSSEVNIPMVPAHSSQMARKILEHLERNPPIPKEKAAELRLATLPKEGLSSDIIQNRNNSSSHLGLDSSKISDQTHVNNTAYHVEDRGKSLVKVPQEVAHGGIVATNSSSSVPDAKFGSSASTLSNFTEPSLYFGRSHDSQYMSSDKDVSKIAPNAAGFEVPGLQKKPPSHTLGTKPALPSILIGKRDQRWMNSSDSSTGFTFPVSASSGSFSDLPTPSIMPSSSASNPHYLSIPSYTFGSNKSNPAFIFPFPSTSSAPAPNDSLDLKFNFGSDEKKRISFSSIGKDAICY